MCDACDDRGVRLFVGLWPTPEVVEGLAALRDLGPDDVRWAARERLHVTLRFLGPFDDVDAVVAALHAGLAGHRPVEARTGERTIPLAGTLVVPVTGVDDLAARIVDVTADLGRPPEDRPFRAHVTIARPPRRGRIPRTLVGQPVSSVTWPVTEVAVVASEDGTYRTLATIGLT